MVTSFVVFLILFGVGFLIGNQPLSLLRCKFDDPEEEMVFSYALGLVLLSYLVLGLGIVGLLQKKYLLLGLGILSAVGFLKVPRLFKILLDRPKAEESDPPPLWLTAAFWIIIFFIGLGAFAPLYGTDALAYHLSSPLGFLRMKRVDLILDDVNSLFPFFTEMLFTLGLVLKNEVVARLFHWSLGVVLAFSVSSFFKRYFGSKKWGRVAAIFLLLTPGMFNEMRSALVDVAWASYGFLSFYSLFEGVRKKDSGRLWLSFIFLGVTMGIKYLAGLSVLATVCVFVVITLRSGWAPSQIFRWLLGMGITLVLVSGYWYLKTYWVYGNPVYPYFNSLFGLDPLRIGSHAPGEYAHKAGMGVSFWSLLLLPFNLTMFPNRFDGWAEQLGPAYLMFLPFAFRTIKGSRPEIRLAVGLYVLIFVLGWFRLAQVTRFLYPSLPFLTLLIVSGIYAMYKIRQERRLFLAVLLFIIFFLNGAFLLYHTRDACAYLMGLEPREVFLLRRERSYEMAKFVRENLPLDAKILNAEEVRTFYFKRQMVRESSYRFRTRYDEVDSYGVVHKRLKLDGFTHLLIADFGFEQENQEENQGIHKWVSPDTQDKRLKLLYRSTFEGRDGGKVDYALFELE